MRIDLHRHLEGSHSPAALAAVAEEFGVRDEVFFDEANARWRTADELARVLVMDGPSDDAMAFYRCITRARAAYVSTKAIRELARRAFLEAAEDTDGFEMRASLFSMTRTLLDNEHVAWRDMPPASFAARAEKVLVELLAARDHAQRAANKPMLVRVGFSRTFESEPHYRELARMLVDHRVALSGLDVLGIVVGADKEPMPAGLRAILDELRPHLPDLTIHAGEFEDHASVERTLALEPRGIGHGVRSLGSDATIARLVEDGVTLEVCPTSNRLLIGREVHALTASRHAAPLRALQQARVHCVLGSDDPTPMGTTFSREWDVASSLGVDMHRLEADIDRRWAQIRGAHA